VSVATKKRKRSDSDLKTKEDSMAEEKVIEVTDADFEEKVLKAEQPVLVDFWAAWCGPCRMMSPVVDELAGAYEGQITVAKLNVDENPQTPAKYGVRGIPNVKLFRGGAVADEVVGAVPRQKLEEMLNKVL
jgi:thioredoxin 1